MNNKMFAMLGIGAIAVVVYKYFMGPQNGMYSVSPFSAPNANFVNGSLQGQPSSQYPFQILQPPRVDNSSQPWYGGPRPQDATKNIISNSSSSGTNFLENVNYAKGAASLTDSLKSIWDNLDMGSWFSSSDNEVVKVDESVLNW